MDGQDGRDHLRQDGLHVGVEQLGVGDNLEHGERINWRRGEIVWLRMNRWDVSLLKLHEPSSQRKSCFFTLN